MSRDMVNWNSNQRADIGDVKAQQRNQRSDLRRTIENLFFAINSNGRQKIYTGFGVTPNSPADGGVNVARGLAIGGEVLEDETYERGVVYGGDTVTSKALDFSSLGAATYGIWVRFSHDPGEPGIRVFYNPNTRAEEAQTVNTRLVHDWDATIASVSPGDEWQKIASVVWDGVSIDLADIANAKDMFFEGDAAASYAHEWGDGLNDRSADRGNFGIGSIWKWVHAVRRQIEEIFDDALGTKWYETPPSNLQECRDHIDATTDPHSDTLTQTNLQVSRLLAAGSIALGPVGGADPTSVFFTITPSHMRAGHDAADLHNNTLPALMSIDFPTASGRTAWGATSLGGSNTATAHIPLTEFIKGAPTGTNCVMEGIDTCWSYTGTGSEMEAAIRLVRVEKSDGTRTTLHTQTIAPSGAASYQHSTASWNAAIDTTLYYYELEIEFEDQGAGTGDVLGLHHIGIQYKRSRLIANS